MAGFPPDSSLTARVTQTWLLLLVVTFGYGALAGLLLQWATGWSWWLGLVAPPAGAALRFAVEGGVVLPRKLPVADADPDGDHRLVAAVDRLCALAGLDRPKLKVVDVDWPNALAFRLPGRRPTVAVTRGLLERCDDERLDAVLAHELSHIVHRDATVMTVAAALSTSLAFAPVLLTAPLMALEAPLCRAARWCGQPWTPTDEDARVPPPRPLSPGWKALLAFTVVPVLGLVRVALYLVVIAVGTFAVPLALLLVVPAAVIIARLGRFRELAADRAAAALTGQPAALAAALTALESGGPAIPAKDLRELNTLAAMSIVALPKASGAKADRPLGQLVDQVFATHPPLQQRLDLLARLTRDLGRG